MRLLRRGLALALAMTAVSPAVAHADFFAAATVSAPAPRTDFDVAIVNASTGARVALPSGVNTNADEIHPDITPDGDRLTFERRDLAAGTVRILLVDLSTGQTSDLYTGFETAQRPPKDPSIKPDRTTIADGGPFTQSSSSNVFFPILRLSNVSNFPTTPYPRGQLSPGGISYSQNGTVSKTEIGGDNLFALRADRSGFNSELVLAELGGTGARLASSVHSFSDPAIAAQNPEFVLFARRSATGGSAVGAGNIGFRPASTSTFAGTPTMLPAIVNSTSDESQPALDSTGRYVAFVRHGDDGHDRLFIWDSQTQTLLNTGGVDLGAVTTRPVGKAALYERPVFQSSNLNTRFARGEFTQPSGAGILVQRIRGRRRKPILGRGKYRLRTVGRIPLGSFDRGRFRKRYKLRVRGKRLKPGRYLITLRAVGRRRTRIVRDLGKSRVIRVKRKRRRH